MDWDETWKGDTLYIEFHDENPSRETLDAAIEHYSDEGFDIARLLSGDDAGDLRSSAWFDMESWDDLSDDLEAYAESTGGAFGMAFSR